MTGWDVLAGRASVPAGMLAELAALRAALPGYDVILTSHSPACRYEAIRRDAAAPAPGAWSAPTPPTCGGNWPAAPRPPPLTVTARTARAAIGCYPADRIPRFLA